MSPDPGAAWVGPALAVVTAAALAIVAATWHPVGDYFAESDFYGGYADGARRLLAGGLDPGRYGVVGPLYEVLLALVLAVVRDAFLAAKIIAVLAAAVCVACWHDLLRLRLGGIAAAAATLLLAANPVFFRHGYSATTDLLAVTLQGASFLAIFGATPRPALAGVLAGLACLSRYSSVFAVLAVVLAALLPGEHAGGRRRTIGRYIAGLAAVIAPWFAYSLAHGHLPGEVLVRSFGFYYDPEVTRNVQDLALPADSSYESLGQVASRPLDFLARIAGNVPAHLKGDVRTLLGWPAAAIAMAGLPALLDSRTRRAMLPIVVVLAALFLTLLPVFHSERYRLPLLPLYLAFAGAAVSSVVRLGLGGRAIPLALLLFLPVFITTVAANVTLQRRVREQLPLEVMDAGRALAADSREGARIMSRKGHVGYYGGRQVVAFPHRATLAELADDARRQRASHLYYSWYEAWLRPEFVWMLDTTAHVPGLTQVHVSRGNPAILFRLGTEFGTDPAWMADSFESRLHEARARRTIELDSMAAPLRIVLAIDALRGNRGGEALEWMEPLTRAGSTEALAWVVSGDARMLLRRYRDAAADYRHALGIDSTDVEARARIDRALMLQNRSDPGR